MDLSVWACPVCLSRLSLDGDAVTCPAEGRSFRRIRDLVILVRPEQEEVVDRAQAFAAAWKKTRWAAPRELIPSLPFVGNSAWRQKAVSFRKLLEVLGPAKERKVVDIGAGNGWLSYRLSEAGFRCFATDASWDDDVGLGGASAFKDSSLRFERAVGTLDRWPIQSTCVDVAICNASLHYMSNVGHALAEAKRVLRPDGTFILMNSPVHADATSSSRAAGDFRKRIQNVGNDSLLSQYSHFVREDLEATMDEYFVDVRRHDPNYGFRFRVSRWIEGRILGMNLASFPIYVARSGS